MKKKIFSFTGLLFAITALYAYWQTAFVLPENIESYTEAALQEILGETSFDYSHKDSGLTHISFHEIKIDKDGFNRIEQINIRYSPLSMFFKRTISEVQILVPDMTLSIDEDALHTSLQRLLASPAPHWIYALDTLSIEGGRLNLLTKNMGALRIGFEGIVRTTDDDKSVQFQINATQKQLSGALKISGALSPNRNWHIDGVLEDGRLDHDLLQLTRITGQMTLDSAGDDGYYAKSELSIGGLRTPSGHALSDMAASYELNQHGFNFVGGGKALGFDDIELGFAYNSDKPEIFTGTIFTPSLPELVRYYKGERDAIAGVDNNRLLQNIFLAYELPTEALWLEEKQVLLRFNQLNITDFSPVFNGDFYGNGMLRGAVKVKMSPDNFIFGGLTLKSRHGNFVFEQPLLGQLSTKIKGNLQSAAFLNKADDFHYETLSVMVTGAEAQSKRRQVTITLDGHKGGADATSQSYSFVYTDDLLWLWDALLGYPQD